MTELEWLAQKYALGEAVAEARKAAIAAATAYAQDPHPFYRESWEKYAEELRQAEVAHENAAEATEDFDKG